MRRTSGLRGRRAIVLALATGAMAISIGWGADPVPVPVTSGVFDEVQAEAGQAAFAQHCASCHGADLQGGFGPRLAPLDPFQFRDAPLAGLFEFMRSQMPFGAPGTLGDDVYAAVLAYVLQRNGYPAGDEALPADPEAWPAFVLDEPPAP